MYIYFHEHLAQTKIIKEWSTDFYNVKYFIYISEKIKCKNVNSMNNFHPC